MAKRGLEEEAFEPSPEMLERAAQLEAPPQGFKLPKKYMSNSQVEMYLRCPRQYAFRYIQDHKRPPGVALTLGTGTHGAAEMTHHHIVDHDVPAPTEAVVDCFADAFEKSSEDIEAATWEREGVTPGAMKDVGVRLVRLYNEQWAPGVRPQVLTLADGTESRGIEKKFTVDVVGVPMLGFIDLIDTNDFFAVSDVERQMLQKAGTEVPAEMRTVVADLKTKAKSASQADVDASLQLTLYSYATKIPAVRYDQLLKHKVPKLKRVSAVRQRADHLWLEEVVHGVASAISAGVFPPCNPMEWVCCEKWCGFYADCRGRRR